MMDSKPVEIPSGVLDELCRGLEDDCGGREDRGLEDDCGGREDRGLEDDCGGREDSSCSPILDSPPRRVKPTKRPVDKSVCPHCHIEMHSRNMKKHISRKHTDTADDDCSPIRDDNLPPRRDDDWNPPPRGEQRAIKPTRRSTVLDKSVCPHCHIEMHSRNMKKHIYRRHTGTADDCGPILDNPPRRGEDDCSDSPTVVNNPPQQGEDDCSDSLTTGVDNPPRRGDDWCSPIQDMSPARQGKDDCSDDSPTLEDTPPPGRVQRAIKPTARTSKMDKSVCPHCHVEMRSRNMKKHIYRRHTDTAVRDTRAGPYRRDASIVLPPPTASPRAVGAGGPFAAQPSDDRPAVVEAKKEPKRKTEQRQHPETNGCSHNMGLLGELDEDQYFFLSLVPACKRMAPRKKAQLKLNIMQMVAQAEFEDTDDGL